MDFRYMQTDNARISKQAIKEEHGEGRESTHTSQLLALNLLI